MIYYALERGRSISKAEGHYVKFEKAVIGSERCLLLVAFLYLNQVKARL